MVMCGHLDGCCAGFGGLWLAFIGLFLIDAARAAVLETTVIEGLQGVRVRDVMSHECATIEPRVALADVAEEILRTGHRCFLVTFGVMRRSRE
jgi:hypothetical protein